MRGGVADECVVWVTASPVHEKPGRKLLTSLSSSFRKKGARGGRSSSGALEDGGGEDGGEEVVVEVDTPVLLTDYTPKDPKKLEFVWCDMACAEVEHIPRAELDTALADRSKVSHPRSLTLNPPPKTCTLRS
jgi:hypothetical protein